MLPFYLCFLAEKGLSLKKKLIYAFSSCKESASPEL